MSSSPRKKAPLCAYHQGILDRGFGRTPYTHMTKRERRERAWSIHRQCLDCQGRAVEKKYLGREWR